MSSTCAQTKVTDAAVKVLIGLKHLEFIGVPDTLSPAAMAALRSAFPDAKIESTIQPPTYPMPVLSVPALSVPVMPTQTTSIGGY